MNQYRRSESRKSRKGSNRKVARSTKKKSRGTKSREMETIQLPLDRSELIAMAQESLHTFAVEIGLRIAGHLLEDEVTRLCGPRYHRVPERKATRYGHQQGVITLAGQKLPIDRPRVRGVNRGAEMDLETYGLLQQEEAMPDAVMRRMVNGVSCRNYEAVVDMACDGFGVRKSSVSRSFIRASVDSVKELAERRFDGKRFAAIMIDGVEYAGEIMVIVLGIDVDGYKHVLGMRQGATENAEVVTSLLEELRERGVATSDPTLFVLDGAKALHAGVKRVWGHHAMIQRCQIHKKRNVMAHVPEQHQEEIEKALHSAWSETNVEAARAQLLRLVKRLNGISPDAAASLQEGLEETITVIRLGISDSLRKTLKSTNPIESALDIVRTLTSRVKRWRGGDMKSRWCAAGLLRAEQKFRRVKGYKQIPQLFAQLDCQRLDTKRKAV
jgi:putative transposase